jgi:hypothetical protein
MKVGAYDAACAREHEAGGKITTSWDFFHNRPFCRLIFKNQWGLYGGDLNGFHQPFVKVILKS